MSFVVVTFVVRFDCVAYKRAKKGQAATTKNEQLWKKHSWVPGRSEFAFCFLGWIRTGTVFVVATMGFCFCHHASVVEILPDWYRNFVDGQMGLRL